MGQLNVAAAHLEDVKARMLWDISRVDFDGLQATLDGAPLSGKLAINLRGSRPAFIS